MEFNTRESFCGGWYHLIMFVYTDMVLHRYGNYVCTLYTQRTVTLCHIDTWYETSDFYAPSQLEKDNRIWIRGLGALKDENLITRTFCILTLSMLKVHLVERDFMDWIALSPRELFGEGRVRHANSQWEVMWSKVRQRTIHGQAQVFKRLETANQASCKYVNHQSLLLTFSLLSI